MTSATAGRHPGGGIFSYFRSLFDFTDFTGTGWVGHDPAMPKGGYDDAIFGNATRPIVRNAKTSRSLVTAGACL